MMAPNPSLPQHHRGCIFMLSVCPNSSYSCSCFPAVRSPFSIPTVVTPELFLVKFLGKTGVAVQLHSMLSVTECATLISTDPIT